MSKFTNIFKKVEPIVKPFVPGGIGMAMDIVKKSVDNDDDPGNDEGMVALAQMVAMLADEVKALKKK